MISQQDFLELDQKIQSIRESGDTEESLALYQSWMNDESYLPKVQEILENSNSTDYLTHFAIKCLKSLISNFSPTWDLEFFLNLSEKLLQLLYNQIDRFYGQQYISHAYCDTYGYLVKLGWHLSHEFRDFFNSFQYFFEGNIKQKSIGILLCYYIVSGMSDLHMMETIQLNSFKETTMFDCFNFSFSTLHKFCNEGISSNSEEELNTLIYNSLQLTFSCLSFDFDKNEENETVHNEIEKMVISLPTTWQDSSRLHELVVLVFQIYKSGDQILQTEALQTILMLSALKKTNTFCPQYLVAFYDEIVKQLSMVIDEGLYSENSIQLLCCILLRTKVAIDAELSTKLESFPNFVRSVSRLTDQMFCYDILINQNQIVNDLLKFWDLMIAMVPNKNGSESKREEFINIIIGICRNTVFLFINLIDTDPKAAIEILFPDFDNITAFLQKITKIARINIEDLFPQLLESLNESCNDMITCFENGTDFSNAECKLCMFTLTIMSFVHSQSPFQKTPQEIHFFCSFSLEIVKLIETTNDILNRYKSGPLLIEKCILQVIYLFRKTSIAIDMINANNKMFYETSGYHNNLQLISLFFRRIMSSLSFFPSEPEIVTLAIKALAEYIDFTNDRFTPVIRDVFVNELMNFEDQDQFAFLFNLPANKNSRIKFYQIMTRIMSKEWCGKLQLLISDIENRLHAISETKDESLVCGLIYDIRGLFIGAESPHLYSSQFSLWFPEGISMLLDAMQSFPSLFNVYLKLLMELVSNTNSRISFDQHSANGLKLFKLAAKSLISFFQNAPSSKEKNSKGFANAMRILETVLTNPNLNIGALEVYNDKTLDELLACFLEFADESKIKDLLPIEKARSILMKLFYCLFEKFPGYIIRIDPSFFRIALECCTIYDRSFQRSDVENAFKLIKYITYFCHENRDDSIVAQIIEDSRMIYDRLLLMLEQMIFHLEQNTNYEVVDLIKNVLKMNPPSWPIVRSRFKLFLEHCIKSEQRENLSGLIDHNEN